MGVVLEKHERIARYAKALSHPIRVYIIDLLSSQPCCYSGNLTDVLPIAKSTLSQHLKELKDAGLVQGTVEGPKVKYCINKQHWPEVMQLFGGLIKELTNKGVC